MNRSVKQLLIAVIALAAAFYAGFVVGERGAESLPPLNLEVTRSELIEALEPTDDQRVSLEAIIARTESETEDMMSDLMTRIRALSDQAEREMREILTEAQASVLDSILSAEPPRRMRRRAPR